MAICVHPKRYATSSTRVLGKLPNCQALSVIFQLEEIEDAVVLNSYDKALHLGRGANIRTD